MNPDGADEAAMRNVQLHGDHAAFAMLVARWEAPIRRLCTRMCGDEHRGEDLTQEAFARVFAHRHQFQSGRKFSTWLWRIAINLCHEDARRLRITEPIDSIGLLGVDRPDQQAIADERCESVRRALAALSEPLRIVVILREYEGLKFREIAGVLNTPEGTVKSRMADALEELGRQLKSIAEPENARRGQRPHVVKERL